MFFLLTNISIGKCYPDIMTQFILGIVCYAIMFFMLKDFITKEQYAKYKYYFGIAIIMDTAFIVYQYKYNSVNKTTIESMESTMSIDTVDGSIKNKTPEILVKDEITTRVPITTTEIDVSFSSDINDFRVSHDLSPETALPVRITQSESEKKNIKIAGYNKSIYDDNLIKSNVTDKSLSFSFT